MATITKLQRPSGTVYKARVRRQGQDGQISKSFKTRTAAERWAHKLEASILEDNAGLVSEGQKHTLKDALDRYRREILPEHSASTRPTYEQRLNYWQDELGHLRLSENAAAKIAGCRDALLTTKTSATVHGYLAVLAAVLTACVKRWHWLKDSPMLQVDKPTVSNGKTRFLSQDELQRLLTACRESSSPDLYLAVLLALTTGARRGELLGLRWRDVDLAKGTLYLRVDHETLTKGSVRGVRIATQVKPLLEARLEGVTAKLKESKAQELDMPAAALVFPSRVSREQPIDLRKPFETALQRAGIENFRWHDLRHSAASFMAANGASLLEIGAVLGHKSAQTTKRYSHLTQQATDTLIQATADRILNSSE